MPNIYQHYSEIADYFGDPIFEQLYLEAISNLSSEALSRLQALVAQAIEQSPININCYNSDTEKTSHT